jgi:hypothetical protein
MRYVVLSFGLDSIAVVGLLALAPLVPPQLAAQATTVQATESNRRACAMVPRSAGVSQFDVSGTA